MRTAVVPHSRAQAAGSSWLALREVARQHCHPQKQCSGSGEDRLQSTKSDGETLPFSRPIAWSLTTTRRSGVPYGRGRRSTAFTMLKTAALTPIPTARAAAVVRVKRGWRSNLRTAEPTSLCMPASVHETWTDGNALHGRGLRRRGVSPSCVPFPRRGRSRRWCQTKGRRPRGRGLPASPRARTGG
jgi:hypothetical protein